MKKWVAIGIIALVISLCPMTVKAYEVDPSELDFGGVDQLLEDSGGDETLKEQTNSRTVGELLEAVLKGDVDASWSDWISAFGTSLWGNLQSYISLMLQVIGLTLLSQFFSSLTVHFGEGSAGNIGFLCVYGILMLVLIESFQIAYEEAKSTVENVRNLSLYMMPAMAAVAVAGGYALSSVMQGEALTAGFSLILTLIQQVFLAGVLWVTVLEVINFISKRGTLTQLTSLARTLLTKGIKAISVLYLMVMGIFGVVTPSADRVIYKASSVLISSVPVVGSALSGAMDSVMAGSALIKNGIGAVGCIVLLCMCLVPVAKLTAFWLMYRLMAAFLAPVADDRIIQLLSSLGRSTAMLLGMLVTGMVIFTGAVGIFVMTTTR